MKFSYSNPTVIHFGQGKIASIAKAIDPSKKVLVIYGGGSIKTNGVYRQVTKALSGRNVVEFGGVEPNPEYDTLMRAVKICKAKKVDFYFQWAAGRFWTAPSSSRPPRIMKAIGEVLRNLGFTRVEWMRVDDGEFKRTGRDL